MPSCSAACLTPSSPSSRSRFWLVLTQIRQIDSIVANVEGLVKSQNTGLLALGSPISMAADSQALHPAPIVRQVAATHSIVSDGKVSAEPRTLRLQGNVDPMRGGMDCAGDVFRAIAETLAAGRRSPPSECSARDHANGNHHLYLDTHMQITAKPLEPAAR